MGIPWICDFFSKWLDFNLGGFHNYHLARLSLDLVHLTGVTFLMSSKFVIMILFPGRVDIHRLGGATARDERPTGEQHGVLRAKKLWLVGWLGGEVW